MLKDGRQWDIYAINRLCMKTSSYKEFAISNTKTTIKEQVCQNASESSELNCSSSPLWGSATLNVTLSVVVPTRGLGLQKFNSR